MKGYIFFLLIFCILQNKNSYGAVSEKNEKSLSLGGEDELSLTSSEVIRLSQVAIGHLNLKKGEGEEKVELVEVKRAKVQIVSGTITTLNLKVKEGEIYKECIVKIWEQPWLQKTEVTSFDCKILNDEKKIETTETVDEKQRKFILKSFKSFMKKYKKIYSDNEEYKKRLRIFHSNLSKIKLLQKNEQETGYYGVTMFADLSPEEFKTYMGYKKQGNTVKFPMAEIPDINLPKEFDWRKYNVVTPVKDQKSCGSCWAFSVTGNVEGQWALKRKELLSLSEQELVDCDSLDGGCNGGEMSQAYEAVIKMGGLETESDYPYKAKNEKCHFNRTEVKVRISGAVNLTQSEEAIAKWLVKNGPVSAGLNAFAMQFYFGGISHPPKFLCDPKGLDHGILIVGFGVQKSLISNRTTPYWIIKNSWGQSWGEHGYYRLYRGKGVCGINQDVTSSIVE